MSRIRCYEWKVTGRGQFPFDMLRYDACYPKHPGDVEAISVTDHRSLKRTVTLVSYVKPATIGRWDSFGWTVTDVTAIDSEGRGKPVKA